MLTSLLLLTTVAFATSEGQGPFPSGPGVLRVQAPSYPEAALKARMYGLAVIDVTISQDGTVASSFGFGTNPLLVGAARRAADGWRFTSSDTGVRCATLVFYFRLTEDTPPDAPPEFVAITPHSYLVTVRQPPPITLTIYDPLPEPCFISTEPWTVTYCDRALRVLPLK
jgi:hypothetical protein